MATKGHEQEAIKVEGMQHSFQKFKNDIIGIPNVTDAVYYTQAEAEAYNAALTGALDDETPLTAEQAAAYNEAITGAAKEAGDTLSTAEANAYNATLDGAVSTTDVKTPAVPTKVKDYVDGNTVTNVSYNSSTGKLQQTKDGTTSDVVSIVNSGFALTEDDVNGLDTLTAIGTATITEDDTNGLDTLTF